MTEILKAQFDEICKGTILPFFKELGFKRKTLHFVKQTNEVTQCFNVQKSQWNSYHNVMFTFNFGFYNADISSILADKEIVNEFPKTYDCFIQNRLGIFSHNRDHWYTLSKNIDVRKTAEQIKTDLEKYLKPMFDNYVSLDTLKQLIAKDEKYISPTVSPHYLIAFYMLTDQMEKGRKTIIDTVSDKSLWTYNPEVFLKQDGHMIFFFKNQEVEETLDIFENQITVRRNK
ncbi:DUF4304 domain-containing protein [Sphingobacterium sp. LRF_L2]|uniref:DUF4304 domain-containing protein n=1 Tax=Sphingobacterium sp. LRF_L2 TaxID=3369421 RepID=UPI003F5FCE85